MHSCSTEDRRTAFYREARRSLVDPSSTLSSYNLRPRALFHACKFSLLEDCALIHLAHLANTASTDLPHFTFLLSDRTLLEHSAVEKAWLSLTVRTHVSAIRLNAYDFDSLQDAEKEVNPLLIRPVVPPVNHTHPVSIAPLPCMWRTSVYVSHTEDSYGSGWSNEQWFPLIRIIAQSRMLREPLFTRVDVGSPSLPLFSFSRFERDLLPPHLFSELAYQKWAARHDEDEMYVSNDVPDAKVDLSRIEHWPVRNDSKHLLMIVMPWMQMGGSEKSMLDIAQNVISRGWRVSFVLTMPFWTENSIGELTLHHEWYSHALQLTSDIVDLLSLAPDQSSSRIFRYLLESRHPSHILMANSRWSYSHSAFIKATLPTAVVADYNHMIHMSWEGGGMPRYGANNSEHFDLHMSASNDVSNAMKKWINPNVMKADPNRVQTCYIGTDPSTLRSKDEKPEIRRRMREKFGIADSAIVVLFAGRLVVDKGIDVVAEVVKTVAKDRKLSQKLAFVFVGAGDKKNLLTPLPRKLEGSPSTFVVLQSPVTGLEELRDYYAMSDVFLLPSVNEGIALVVYEAMADGLLVVTTDVGGQREVVMNHTGILLPNYPSVSSMASHTVESLRQVAFHPADYDAMRQRAREMIRSNFTTEQFTNCVVKHLVRVSAKAKIKGLNVRGTVSSRLVKLQHSVSRGLEVERFHGKWNRDVAVRPIEGYVTVGIKTYVCDQSIKDQVENLLRTIRTHHPRVRVLLANDGPTALSEEASVRNDPYTEEYMLPADSGISFGRNYMVNLTSTRYFLLLDDDHVFDDTTNLKTVVTGIRDNDFDMVGMRVRNLPGIDEYERIGILIPRYVALIQSLEDKVLTLCVWNENNGPSVYGITHPIPVDVLHNAFMASTDVLRKHPWRNELKVNEHMTFFLDAKDAKLKVGYLPSVFVHHRARDYSDCYYKVRFREEKYVQYLRYKDQFSWDTKCGNAFPNRVKQHILLNELDAA